MKIIDKARNLDVGWYGAAAGAAAAGAALFPQSRIGAGLVGGLLVLAIGIWRTPCCADCAGARPAAELPADNHTAAPAAISFPTTSGATAAARGGC
jgi:hypothetical protein